jgi:glycosyltransferase involved in cell wall biosynthesis
MRDRPVVFFADRGDATFIHADLRMLSAFARIKRHSFRATRWTLLPELLRSLWGSLKEIPRSDVVMCHFGGWNSWIPLLLARFFNKPSALVVHGTDCVSFPSIGYGNFRKWPLKAVTAGCFRSTSRIVPVHESLIESESDFATGIGLRQGIRVHCPGLRTPITTLHHGFDPDRWCVDGTAVRSGALTVATGLSSERTRILKGIDLIIACARSHPGMGFTIVGLDPAWMEDLPPNIEAVPSMPQASLLTLYQRSMFYLQLSMSEGFGCALAEAMLCGCVPIVSNAGSLPDVAGDTGYVLERRDAHALRDLLLRAMDAPVAPRSIKARQRIMERFPEERRSHGLRTLVYELLESARSPRNEVMHQP